MMTAIATVVGSVLLSAALAYLLLRRLQLAITASLRDASTKFSALAEAQTNRIRSALTDSAKAVLDVVTTANDQMTLTVSSKFEQLTKVIVKLDGVDAAIVTLASSMKDSHGSFLAAETQLKIELLAAVNAAFAGLTAPMERIRLLDQKMTTGTAELHSAVMASSSLLTMAGDDVKKLVEGAGKLLDPAAFDALNMKIDAVLTRHSARLAYSLTGELAADAAAHAEQVDRSNVKKYGATSKMGPEDKMRNALDYMRLHWHGDGEFDASAGRRRIEAELGRRKPVEDQPA